MDNLFALFFRKLALFNRKKKLIPLKGRHLKLLIMVKFRWRIALKEFYKFLSFNIDFFFIEIEGIEIEGIKKTSFPICFRFRRRFF